MHYESIKKHNIQNEFYIKLFAIRYISFFNIIKFPIKEAEFNNFNLFDKYI